MYTALCLSVFPLGVFFVLLCFISLLKKTLFLHLSPRLYLSSRFLTIVHPKMQILSLITHSHVVPRRSFLFGTQIKIFLMKSESFLTLHRQQQDYYNQGPERQKAQWYNGNNFFFDIVLWGGSPSLSLSQLKLLVLKMNYINCERFK